MVNLVLIGNQRYLVDVGFGGAGPCRPMPLISGHEVTGMPPQSLKLEYRSLAEHTDSTQRLWVYSYREDGDSPWVDAYAFTELEFFPSDFRVMNLSTMTLRSSFFVQTVLCVSFILNAETGEPEGLLILQGAQVRKKVHGEYRILEELKTEEQRIQALQKWFGIRLNEEEQRGILGLPTELRGKKNADS